MDRLTFQLEQDASGEVDVHVHKTQVNIFANDFFAIHGILLLFNERWTFMCTKPR